MEYQANLFARHLLMPYESFKLAFANFLTKENITKIPIYVDSQRCNIALCNKLCLFLGDKFNVSKQVARIALKQHKWLIDANDTIDYLRHLKMKAD